MDRLRDSAREKANLAWQVWRCETCEFDVCKACMASEVKINGRHAHPVTRKVISDGNVVICDGCDRNVLEGLPRDAHRPIRFHCAAGCDFDLCLECGGAQSTEFSGTKGLAPKSKVKVVNGQERTIIKALEADLGRVAQPQRPLGAAPLSPTGGGLLGDAEQIASKIGKWSRYVGCGQVGSDHQACSQPLLACVNLNWRKRSCTDASLAGGNCNRFETEGGHEVHPGDCGGQGPHGKWAQSSAGRDSWHMEDHWGLCHLDPRRWR